MPGSEVEIPALNGELRVNCLGMMLNSISLTPIPRVCLCISTECDIIRILDCILSITSDIKIIQDILLMTVDTLCTECSTIYCIAKIAEGKNLTMT